MQIGTIVSLLTPLLGCKALTKGVVVDIYTSDNQIGYMVIFKNGEYDGFSEDECSKFLSIIDYKPLTYEFISAIRLSRDYNNKLFESYLC